MTSKELRRIISALPDDRYVGFSLDLAESKDNLKMYVEAGEAEAPLELCGFEMSHIGDEDDELSIIIFKVTE